MDISDDVVKSVIDAYVFTESEPDEEPELSISFIVARDSRGGSPKSIKPSNITRDISRSLRATLLAGALPSALPGAFAFYIALLYSVFEATSANVSYNAACVLHWIWQNADEDKIVQLHDIISARQQIATEYKAPKLAGETEIRDVLLDLIGLNAIVLIDESRCRPREKIVFFRNGAIEGGGF